MGMTAGVAATREKVQQYLTRSFGSVTVDQRGTYPLRHGSSRIFVAVHSPDGRDETFVKLEVPLLRGVKETPEALQP